MHNIPMITSESMNVHMHALSLSLSLTQKHGNFILLSFSPRWSKLLQPQPSCLFKNIKDFTKYYAFTMTVGCDLTAIFTKSNDYVEVPLLV